MLYPMVGMVLWTVIVLLIAFRARMGSIESGQVSLGSYKLLDRGDLPEDVMKTTRNYLNLFEMPVLFYAGCLACLAMNLETTLLVFSAWAYLFFRIAHTIIHIGPNNVIHRLYAFMLSNISLVGLWIGIILATL